CLRKAGTNVTFQFDLCDVIGCGDKGCNWRGYDLYLCPDPKVNSMCGKGWHSLGQWCPLGWVTQWTGPDWTPSTKNLYSPKGKLIHSVKFMRGQLSGSGGTTSTPGCNPLLLSIVGLTKNDLPGNPQKNKLYFVLGVSQSGTDWKSLLKISLLEPQVSPSTNSKGNLNHTSSDTVRIATGYGDRNMWLDWVTASALSMGMSNCVACSSARTTLFTTPAPLLPTEDPAGFNLMLGIHMTADPVNCTTFSRLFPPASNTSIPPIFTPRIGNYTCLTRSNSTWMGQMPTDWCQNTLNVALPVFMLGQRTGQAPATREKHEVSFDLTKNSPTYIDAIGVPRGVPDEYKLVNQVAAGFENIPILSAYFPVTPNKNVDCINYIHYNTQRLANLTCDTVEGLSEQTSATSLMTVQNRVATDFLLADRGGVCAVFEDQCCTFIPNNTAPDGSVTKALEGLRTLSNEMREHSGINNPLEAWMNRMFGKWKNIVVSVLISLISITGLLILCGCCCIPCIRALCIRLITTAIEKPPTFGTNPPLAIKLLCLCVSVYCPVF
uniref:Uncharacterized protein n=1 Tax=Monopterus albus TaxID=43700 RepID=A0A3Q3QQM4_MONAL